MTYLEHAKNVRKLKENSFSTEEIEYQYWNKIRLSRNPKEESFNLMLKLIHNVSSDNWINIYDKNVKVYFSDDYLEYFNEDNFFMGFERHQFNKDNFHTISLPEYEREVDYETSVELEITESKTEYLYSCSWSKDYENVLFVNFENLIHSSKITYEPVRGWI
jgi:hypothetical protein